MTAPITIGIFFFLVLFFYSPNGIRFHLLALLSCILEYFKVLPSNWFDISIKLIVGIIILESIWQIIAIAKPKSEQEKIIERFLPQSKSIKIANIINIIIFSIFLIVYVLKVNNTK